MSPKRLEITIPDSDDPKPDPAAARAAETMIASHRVDTSGVSVKGKLADVVRLVLQAGFAVVAFSAVIGGGIWGAMAIRTDYKHHDAETRADHKDEVQQLLKTFSEQQKIAREDMQEREKRHETGQQRMWSRLGEVVDAQREATAVLRGAANDLKVTADELKKISGNKP